MALREMIRALAFLAIASIAFADTVITPAQSAIGNLKDALREYAKSHDGHIFQSFDEIDPYLKRSIEHQLGQSLSDGVTLLSDDVQMANSQDDVGFNGGKIIAITSNPIEEKRRRTEGRYVIWRDKNGEIKSSWLNEQVVADQFHQAGVSLPSGPSLEQPDTRQFSIEYLEGQYAEENFKDPKNPTAEEIEKMKQDFGEKYGNKPATTPLEQSTPVPEAVMPQPTPSTSPSPTAAEEKPASEPGFPIVPVVILVAVIAGAAVFFLRRKS